MAQLHLPGSFDLPPGPFAAAADAFTRLGNNNQLQLLDRYETRLHRIYQLPPKTLEQLQKFSKVQPHAEPNEPILTGAEYRDGMQIPEDLPNEPNADVTINADDDLPIPIGGPDDSFCHAPELPCDELPNEPNPSAPTRLRSRLSPYAEIWPKTRPSYAIYGMKLIQMKRLALLSLIVVAPAAFAQDAPVVNKGTTEIGGFIGASYGTQNFQVMGGGNVAYAVTKAIMPYAEFSYFPGLPISHDLTGTIGDKGTTATANYRLPLSDFHAGIHYRIPIKESPFVPYGVFGLGLLHSSQSTYDFNYIQFGNKVTQQNTLASDNNFAVNFGAGVRYYTRQKVGFRAEAKFYHVGGIVNGIFSKYEFGVFYQFH